MPLRIRLSKSAARYYERLDKPTKQRILNKLEEIAEDHSRLRIAKPLQGDNRFSARVGGFRILFLIEGDAVVVSTIGPRGQVYGEI